MKLTRKNFVKGLAIGTLSLPFLVRGFMGKGQAQGEKGSAIVSGKKYQWKMVTTWPPNFPVLGESCTLFAKWVEELTGGRMQIRVYGAGELVPALEVFDTVRSGATEMGSGAAYYWAGKIPAAQFFASVPFGMNAQQVNSWLISGGGLELWQELYRDYGLIPLMGGNTGTQMGGWFNREINSMEDLKGLKMRIPGLGGKVLERAGGSPILLAGGEIYTGLERGVIDAAEWVGPYHDYKMGFHQIAKYYYAPGWHEWGSVLELLLNQKAYDELPADIQAALYTAGLRLNHWMLCEFEAQNSIYLKKLIEEEGVNVKIFPREVLRQLKSITEEVLVELTEKDPASKKIYASYRSFKERARIWADVSEKLYYGN
ncbi:MAG: TRAP transporter substrate-binding protein [Saprospirales bacterium]|nr:TRAP transporter substrate-binding protein [Saprospirales bacterium]